jgi:spore coat polysaccharide biosynthesis predicted glycosyltransferase SpsG
VVLDSYDYVHTASAVGCETTKHNIIILDDLAYQREYTPAIVAVVPNICSCKQQAMIASTRAADGPMCLYGPEYILLDRAFCLSFEEKLAILKERQHRLSACFSHNKSLVVLVCFGGSGAGHTTHAQRDYVATFLKSAREECAEIEVRCLGAEAVSVCEKIGESAYSLGWLNLRELRQAYLDTDVYVGSIGYSMWERASLLLPSFVIPTAANQHPYADTGEELGVHCRAPSDNNFSILSASHSMLRSAVTLKLRCSGYSPLFKDYIV